MTALLQPFPMEVGRRAQAWRYQPQFRRPRHFHGEPELNVFVRGSARVQVGSRELELQAGMLLWLPPLIDHALLHASHDLEFCVVGVRPELADALSAAHELTLPSVMHASAVGQALMTGFADVCQAMTQGLDALSGDVALVELLRQASPAATAAQGPTLGERASNLVVTDPSVDRQTMAKRLASNRGDISRAFQRALGMTFRDYKQRARVLSFLENVDAGQNMTRAALAAGFGSYSQCHRVISRITGCSPRSFLEGGIRAEQESRFEPLSIG